jgi:hypothetical protein
MLTCFGCPPQDKHADAALLARYSVVLTTYGTLASEAPAGEKQSVRLKKQVRRRPFYLDFFGGYSSLVIPVRRAHSLLPLCCWTMRMMMMQGLAHRVRRARLLAGSRPHPLGEPFTKCSGTGETCLVVAHPVAPPVSCVTSIPA